jgi:hypothetical protein
MSHGGIVDSFQALLARLDSPAKLLYGFILILTIVYSPLIPKEYRAFVDSPIGRILGLALVYGVIEWIGWVYGLLTAMAFLLFLHARSGIHEGFDGGGSVSEKKTIGKRWFVEKVLGERTTKIATDRVMTQAITD